MTTSASGAGHDPRADEDDQDLLTYTEAGVRLDSEAAAVREELRAAEDAGRPTDLLTRRLADLEAARERNRVRAVNDETFEQFFGYPPRRDARSGAS